MRLKRLISAFIACAMLVTFMPMQAFATPEVDNAVKATKTLVGETPDAKGNYTIQLTVRGDPVTSTTTSKADVVLVVDNSGSMATSVGSACGASKEKFVPEEHLLWITYTCPDCGAKYTSSRKISGNYAWDERPDTCTGEIGAEPRIKTAQKVGKKFASSILNEETDNQMAVIGFSHGDRQGGATDQKALKVCQGLTNNFDDITNAIDDMEADGGTNYSAALQQAYKWLVEEREDASRPAYVIFISDGAPGLSGESIGNKGWDGSKQAAALKDAGVNLYTIGIALDENEDEYLESLASDTQYYRNVTGANYDEELSDILDEWADEINTVPAGTNAVMTDVISDNFTLVPNSQSNELKVGDDGKTLTWNIGDIPEEQASVQFKVHPNDGVSGKDIKTNESVTLTYTANGENQKLENEQIGVPTVDIAAPAQKYEITVEVVNGSAKYNDQAVSSPISIDEGDNATISFEANAGYALDTVTVDGQSAELTVGEYTFENVTANHIINVVFAEDKIGGENGGGDGIPDKYQVFVKYVSADVNMGTVSGSNEVITFENGATSGDVTTSQASAQPNADFEFDKWTVDYPTETPLSDSCLLEPQNFVDVPGGTTITFTAHFKSETQPYQLTFDANSGLINDKESFTLDLYADDLETDKLLYAPKLPDYVSMTVPENTVEDVVFAYWSQENTNGRIFERGEDQLPDMCELVSFEGTRAVTVYAVWSTDVNDNGKPDILEDTYTLTLNANGGKIEHREAYEVPETYWSGDLVTPAEVGDLDMTAPDKAVLIGWSKEDTKKHIYTANDTMPLPQIVDAVRFEDQDITLYAVWGEDSDGDGNPDITEEKYTLQYDANGGTGVPNDRAGLLLNQLVTLDEGATMRHDDVDGKAVVFVGWSTNRENKIFGKNDAAPEIVSEVTIKANEFLINTVYAVWGYDENNDGKPDVTEGQYLVSYAWTGAPEGVSLPAGKRYLADTDVPVDSTYTKDTVVKGVQDGVKGFYTFSGWSTQDVTITADNQFKIPEKDVTLNGTWTFTKDENGDKIPDERQIFVNYRSNAERYGTVSAEAANKVFTFTEEEIAAAKENGDKLSVRKLHAQATETSDGDFDRWTTSADFGTLFPVRSATLDVEVTFTVDQLGETLEVVANFDRETGGGGAHHPDAGDDDDDDNDRDDEDDTEESIDEEVPLAETPWLNTVDHYAYIVGYPEDYVTGQPTEDESRWPVKPQANISRAEVATIFFRLLTDEARDQFWMTTNNFPDVAPDAWYNNAISTMVNAGIIQGYEDGTFRPNNNITRAEFAAIASRFMSSGYDVEEDLFTDIANHWARENINDAAMTQWIHGYPDGTFLPDQAITRAEAVTLVNNVLQRKPDADHMFDSMIKWPDNPEGTWYYEAIQEATNSHDYDLFEDAEYETWTALQENRDWAALEKDWVNTHRTGGEVA